MIKNESSIMIVTSRTIGKHESMGYQYWPAMLSKGPGNESPLLIVLFHIKALNMLFELIDSPIY